MNLRIILSRLLSITFFLALFACSATQTKNADSTSEARFNNQRHSDNRPNIIYILVDDMGIGDIQPYGQKIIQTPNLSRMAAEGMLFTQHYAGNTVCAPSRAALITGQHSGHGQIRGNYELGGFEDDNEWGQMPLHPATKTLGKVLQAAGYTTALIGKWGLGGPSSYGVPTKQGFDYFFGYLDQKQAHNHYPTHLWEGENWFPLNNAWLHSHAQLPPGANPNDPAVYEAFKREDFAQQRLTDRAVKYIAEKHDKPFFLYLSYAAPHAALQAPEEEIAAYHHLPDTPYDGKSAGRYLPSFRPRATRAAMISHIDKGVGAVFAKLKEHGLDDNTLVIFSSDNGPSFEGGADLKFFDSNAEFRGYKRDLYEGGIRMPTLARWPGKIAPNSINDHVSAFWDVLPTLAEIAGGNAPKNIDGISFLPSLTGTGNQKKHEHLYWEFHHFNGTHSQAIRIRDDKNGDWKALRFFKQKGDVDPPIELYNLRDDPAEKTNLASQYLELVRHAKKVMRNSRTRSFIDAWNFDYYKGKR